MRLLGAMNVQMVVSHLLEQTMANQAVDASDQDSLSIFLGLSLGGGFDYLLPGRAWH